MFWTKINWGSVQLVSVLVSDADFQKFAGNSDKRIAGYSLPRIIARLTPTTFRERPKGIGRRWVFPPYSTIRASIWLRVANNLHLTFMKHQTCDFEDDSVKSRIRCRTPLRTFTGRKAGHMRCTTYHQGIVPMPRNLFCSNSGRRLRRRIFIEAVGSGADPSRPFPGARLFGNTDC